MKPKLEKIPDWQLDALCKLADFIRKYKVAPSMSALAVLLGDGNKTKSAAQQCCEALLLRKLIDKLPNVRYGKYVPTKLGMQYVRKFKKRASEVDQVAA